MKKIFIALSIIITSATVNKVNAQAVDQFTALESIGEGSLFDWYYLVSTTNGVTSGPFDATYTLKFEKDVPTRGDAFEMYKEGATSPKGNSGFGFLEANHLTKPSCLFFNDKAYVYINGLMYKIGNFKDPQINPSIRDSFN